jgi:protein required for attachment to host cells
MAKSNLKILIADGSTARLIEQDPACRTFLALDEQVLEQGAPPSRDIASDRPGRTFDCAGQGRHAKEPPTDPHRHAKHGFVRSVADWLEELDNKGALEQLVLVAAPQALGDFRELLPDRVRAKVVAELDKDLTPIPTTKLDSHLDPILASLRGVG